MKKVFLIVALLAGLLAGQLVNAQNSVTITPNPAAICEGSSINLTAVKSGGIASTYVWNTGQTGSVITVSPLSTTDYTVTVTFITGTPTTATATVTVTVNPQPTTPTITVGGPFLTICQGESLALTSSVATSYVWQKNGSLILGSNVQTYDAASSGDYKVRITDINGCNSSWSLATTVSVIPLPVANVTVDNTETCFPDNITLTADPVTGASYQWWYSPSGLSGTWSHEPGVTNVIYGTTSGYYGVRVIIGGCDNESFVW